MAYFPNGTSQAIFEEEWCFDCINFDESEGCPITLAHLLHNYDQIENQGVHAVLNCLIDDSDGYKCRMFSPIRA